MYSFIGLALAYINIIVAAVYISIKLLPQTGFYPCINATSHESLNIEFIYQGHTSITSCKQRLQTVENAMRLACPTCRIEAGCSSGLDKDQRRKLTSLPLAQPSIKLSEGVLVFVSPYPEIAGTACIQTGEQLKKIGGRCFMPNQGRPRY